MYLSALSITQRPIFMIDQNTLDFLKELKENNNRDWFQEHKSWYEESRKDFKSFVQKVRLELIQRDGIEKTKVYRIYRDLRFTKDKTPYKTHFAAHFTRAGKYRRGGFYLQVSSDEILVAGGFWGPNRDDLQFIREGIVAHADDLRAVLNQQEVVDRFGGLTGDELKTAPRGYDRDHPNIDLLRKKQFILQRKYPVAEALQPEFYKKAASDFEAMIPVFDVVTDYLVYDGNGVER